MRFIVYFFFLLALGAQAQEDSIPYIAHHTDDIVSITYSPDSKFIVSAGWDESVVIQKNDSSAEVVQVLTDFKGAVNSVTFSRDGNKLLAGGQDGNIRVYTVNSEYFDVATKDTTLQLNNAPINRLIYGPGLRTIFSADNAGKFITYDLAKKKVIPIRGTVPITAAAVSIDRMSIFIAVESSSVINQFDPFGKLVRVFEGHTNDITDLLTTVDRKYVISSSKDKSIRVWEIATGKEVAKLENHTWTITDIDVDPFGTYLVSGGLDGVVNVYDLKTYALLRTQTFSGYKVNAVALAPNYSTIAIAASQNGITNPAGFFMMNTYLPRRLSTTEKQALAIKNKEERAAAKKARAVELKAAADVKAAADAKALETKPATTPKNAGYPAPAAAKKNEKVIKKTEQVEIRIEETP
jgi:WD40 repeat protein